MEISEDTKRIRRVYGRGMFDGLAMAGIENPREYMNAQKMIEAEKAQSGIAKKVLAVMSDSEEMNQSQIYGALRNNGTSTNLKIVAGCVETLRKAGLVREVQTGVFVRVAIKERPKMVLVSNNEVHRDEKQEPVETPTAADEPEFAGPLEMMAAIAEKAKALGASVTALAASIEEVAIEVEEKMQAIQRDHEKVAQLKTLLKSLAP